MAELRQRCDLSAANWRAAYDIFSTMKLSLSTIIAVALSLGVIWAEGPAEKAKDVAEDAAETVKNVGNEKHNFVVRGKDGTHKFMVDLQPNETKVLHVQLKRGTYSAYSPLDGHPKKGTET